MRPYDPDQPVIFAHIPKCAGTSFIRLLRQWFGDEYYHPHVNESEQGTTLPKRALKDENGDWCDDIRCIHAHFDHGRGYGLPYHFPEVTQYFSFIRDPFDIVVSMYFFAKGKSAKGEFLYDGRQVDIREQYPSIEHYVKEPPTWLYNHFPQDITLENYREQVPERFIYLGLFDEMDVSIRELGKILNKPNVELPKKNQSHYDEDVPERLRLEFYEEHPLLVGIYEIAKENYLVSGPDSSGGKLGVGRIFANLFGRES